MNFGHPVSLSQLEEVFSEVKRAAETEADWYKRHRWRPRFGSYLTRIVAAAGLAAGIIFPLFPGKILPLGASLQVPMGAESGYVALVIAGLVFLVDQVFMWSRNWPRYMQAHAQIETLILIFELDWLKMKASIVDDAAAFEKCDEAIDLFQKLIVDVRGIVEAETRNWESQLEEARQLLAKKLGEHSSTAKKVRDKYIKEMKQQSQAGGASKTGGLIVTIQNHEKLKGPITVTVGDRTEKRPTPIDQFAFDNIAAIQLKVTLRATMLNGDPLPQETLVTVKPQKIETVTLGPS